MSFDVTTLALAKTYTNQHSGGGEQVQPDWNQNDETAKDYIKNRPFYTETTEAVLVEETTVSFADTGRGFYTAYFPSNFEATVGETYKVSWDGTAYECTCVNFNDIPAIGNLSIEGIDSDTGEPFLVDISDVGRIDIATKNTSASHTFSISGFAQEVVKIDEKYLPDTVKSEVEATQEVLDDVFSSVATFTFDKQTSGRDTFKFNSFHYYKISDFNPAPEDVISFKGTIETGNEYSEINIGNNCVEYGGIFIIVASAGDCSLHPLGTTTTKHFIAPSAGLYAMYEIDDPHQTARTGEFTLRASTESLYITGLLLKSSTAGSTKKFRITVDDDYNVSATNTSDSVSKALATTEYVDNSVSNPLNITSAAVGQIAKITAVDDSGKPTAWEPVDMPSGGGVTTLHINVTAVNKETMEATFTADKTPTEMQQASANGPTWCVVSFPAGILAEEAFSIGLPPAWRGGVAAFGLTIWRVHEDGGDNQIAYVVWPALADTWGLDLSSFGS